ncbi:MAG: NAD(P)/FAD-dependent oxidoreductase [Isosphaeraceae bacterium]|nr:NAD(P)/FAD-dependent oxidoreductase [Isosphaeraceae bacterium]
MASGSHGYEVAVLGAGAAGLCAAIRAAERGRSVVLLEKNRRPGVKILMSGGTRCNITNARGLRNLRVVSGPIDPAYDPRQARGARSIQEAFGPVGGKFLGPALKALGVEQTIQLFESEGVATKVEANGKVFPVSDKATDVLAALLRRLERSGANLRTSCPAQGVQPIEEGFEVATPAGPIRARRVIVAVGGQSYPGCGTTGDGYAIARRFGHTIREPRPALVPIRVAAGWVSGLSGLAVPDARAAVIGPSGTLLQERREAILFAHFGLTGPAILDISRAVARHDDPERLTLSLDFTPDERAEALDAWLQAASRAGRPSVAGLLAERIPRRLAEALLSASEIPVDRIGPELTRDERRRLVAALKGLRLPIGGTLGFAKAEVTSGGVALDEINPETLESRLQPGLHFVGEVLDLDGLIGGYNFQAAWSTGWLAGESV